MSRRTKHRILAIGQAGRSTGYARVMSSILSRLTGGFEITLFAVDNRGPGLASPYMILPNNLLGDPFGKAQLPSLLNRIQPELVFICHDHTFYSVHERELAHYRSAKPKSRVVVYCPIEWADTPSGNLSPLARADRIVFYTEFGLEVFERAARESENLRVPPTAVIPHGVDTSVFYPLAATYDESRYQARRELFSERRDLQDAFIVLNANRNCPRKRIDLTLRAFAEFSRGKPDAYLYLHMGMLDSGCDILAIAGELSISGRLLLTTSGGPRPIAPDSHLNLIYNACDIGVNTSAGEGWGLTAFEHAAAMGAQLVPDHSACRDLWKGQGCLIGVEKESSDQGLVSISDMVMWLNRLYSNRNLLIDFARRGYRYARSERFSWDNIAKQWAALFDDVLRNEADQPPLTYSAIPSPTFA